MVSIKRRCGGIVSKLPLARDDKGGKEQAAYIPERDRESRCAGCIGRIMERMERGKDKSNTDRYTYRRATLTDIHTGINGEKEGKREKKRAVAAEQERKRRDEIQKRGW